jgi:hypothetical protein
VYIIVVQGTNSKDKLVVVVVVVIEGISKLGIIYKKDKGLGLENPF